MSRIFLLFAVILLAAGCAASRTLRVPHADQMPYSSLAVMDATSGRILSERQFLGKLREAQVIVLAEHRAGDASNFAQQVVLITMIRELETHSALSAQWFSRDQQPLINQWLAREISTVELVGLTGVEDQVVEGEWMKFHQPLLDWARLGGWPIVASNAPLRFSHMVWRDGLEALANSPESHLFSMPLVEDTGDYAIRMMNVLRGTAGLDEEASRNIFLAQRLYDATMADSILHALDTTENLAQVVHPTNLSLVRFNGGILQELRARRPDLRLLVLAIGRNPAEKPETDPGSADYFVYLNP